MDSIPHLISHPISDVCVLLDFRVQSILYLINLHKIAAKCYRKERCGNRDRGNVEIRATNSELGFLETIKIGNSLSRRQ